MTSALPKLLALTFSLMLGGGYVWFRAGGSIPYLAPAKPKNSVLPSSKVGFTETPVFREASDVVAPPEIQERAERNQTFFSGSKSDRPFTQDSIQSDAGDPAEPIFHSVDRDSRNQRVILGGSKSSAVEITSLHAIENLITKPTPTPDPVTKYSQYRTPSPRETVDERFLMPSSKTGAIHFEFGPQPEPKSEPKPQPQPIINNPKPQTPVQRERTFLPGSKSFDARESGSVYTRPPVVEIPMPEPATQQRRTILPGSKSMIIPDDEFKAFEYKEKLEPLPAPTPKEKQPRTILPGSKSFGVGLPPDNLPITLLRPRLNPNATKSQPTPGPDAGNRQSSIVNRPSPPPPSKTFTPLGEEEDQFETVIVQEVETTTPDGKKVRTLLPGSKSAFQPIEPIQQKPSPSTTPPPGLIQPKIPDPEPAQKQQRTMLSGSKSQVIGLERRNPDATATPQPAPADSNRQSSIVNRQSAPPEAPPAQSQQSSRTNRGN